MQPQHESPHIHPAAEPVSRAGREHHAPDHAGHADPAP
jgi:hypothetical protein